MSNEFKSHIKNIKVLMTEFYKFLNNLSTLKMKDIPQKRENYYSLRNPKLFLLCRFSFTNIHESQDCRGRGRAFL